MFIPLIINIFNSTKKYRNCHARDAKIIKDTKDIIQRLGNAKS